MPRPEQRGKTKRAKAHTGKHGGEIVDGQRCDMNNRKTLA